MAGGCVCMATAAPLTLCAMEDSTDESEREDEEYEQLTAHYSALIRRAVREAGPDLEALPLPGGSDETTTAEAPAWANGARSNGGVAERASGTRRLYFCGFGASLTAVHIHDFLAQFGALENFRLFVDPVTSLSLRAAGVVYHHAADAARALEAAADGMVYLNNVWAPEAMLMADPTGENAQRYYESQTRAPVPPLLPPPFDHRGLGTGRATNEVVPSYARLNDGGVAGGGLLLVKPQRQENLVQVQRQENLAQVQRQENLAQVQRQESERARCTRLIVSGLPPSATPMGVKNAFSQFGFLTGFIGGRHPSLASSPRCSLRHMHSCMQTYPCLCSRTEGAVTAGDRWSTARGSCFA